MIIPVVIGNKLCEGIIIEISGISELKIGDKDSASSYNLNGLEINKDVMAIITIKILLVMSKEIMFAEKAREKLIW